MDEDSTVPPEVPRTSFKDALLNKSEDINLAYVKHAEPSELEIDPDEKVIILSEKDKQWIDQPWKHSVIVKLFGKKLAYKYLKNKLQDMWKPSEPLTLIDLGHDFYTTKFEKLEKKCLKSPTWGAMVCYWELSLRKDMGT